MADMGQVRETIPSGVEGLPPEGSFLSVIRELFPRETATPARFRRRSYVYGQGNPVGSIFCLVRGMVALERIDVDGRMAMLGVMKGGALLAWNDLVDGGIHRNSAQALTSCELLVIPCEKFRAALHSDERLLASLMQQSAAQMGAYEDHILRLSTLDVPERIYSTLCALAGIPSEEGSSVELSTPLLKRDLAAMVGTSPESISRGLRRLEELEVAEYTDHSTFLLHPLKRR